MRLASSGESSSELCPALKWDPTRFTQFSDDDHDNISNFLENYKDDISREIARAAPNTFTIFTIVFYDPELVPSVEHPMTYNTYGINTSTVRTYDERRFVTNLDAFCEHYAVQYASHTKHFTGASRYYDLMTYLVATISTDAAVAALEKRPTVAQDEKVNQLIFDAFEPFIGLISVVRYMKDGTTKIAAFLPMGIRPTYQN